MIESEVFLEFSCYQNILLNFLSSCQKLADKSPCQEKWADNLMHFKQDF